MGGNDFDKKVEQSTGHDLCCEEIGVLQVNVGLRCTLSCAHCHLQCGPERKEVMSWSTMQKIVDVAKSVHPALVDITGGSPELNPNFRKFIEEICRAGLDVQVRTNLTVLLEPSMETVPEFLKELGVRIVASMPCYLEKNVDAQRGSGVYERNIKAMKRLNELGYGIDPKLPLNLVYNPGGAFLPPDQSSLESDYHHELENRFGVRFNHLITIANMPIGRFVHKLKQSGEDKAYMRLLKESFNTKTIDGLMCRHQVSIGWDGMLYDCDFNLALGMAVNHGAPDHIKHFDLGALAHRRICTGEHCFGCTAGCGSSCSGALI